MKNIFVVLLIFCVSAVQAQCHNKKNRNVRNASYHHSYSSSDIVDVAAGNDDFSTLVAAVKAADLVETLQSDGPFTVFAPDNAAFAKLPDGTLGSLLETSNKKLLTSILTYHVLAGQINASDLIGAIKVGGGEAKLKTVEGGALIARISGDTVLLIDEKGGKSAIKTTDINADNGVIHVIDTVVLPN
ncbi:MAG: fasciclin domain-containing protein [Bacteroidota bacterium]